MANDFLFTSYRGRAAALKAALGIIPDGRSDRVRTFTGNWGTLAVTGSYYGGFAPVETATEVIAVVGAPVLGFANNSHLADINTDTGTRAVHERLTSGLLEWSSDLSGPFAVVRIDKVQGWVTVASDLMSFIPIYHLHHDGVDSFGTHTDALAKSQLTRVSVDEASLVDLVLHGVITYPYTNYVNMRQLPPATISALELDRSQRRAVLKYETYWLPRETERYGSLPEAARDLEDSLTWYATAVTGDMETVAHLASGGEDSRVVASILPKRLERHAFVATDSFNREARIAERVALRVGANFHHMLRSERFYLDGMSSMGRLVGYNSQSTHAHFYGLTERFGLSEFPAVFGGYFADSIIKASAVRKGSLSTLFRFLPDRLIDGEARTDPVSSILFSDDLLVEVTERRVAHFERVLELRPESAHEWFAFWPVSMRKGSPNITAGRRLMANFEPFTSSRVVKLGAGTRAAWKVNRKLFRLGAARFLKETRYVPHGDGRYPYYPWWVNSVVQLPTWTWLAAKRLGAAAGFKRTYEGPWSDWYGLVRSGALAHAAEPFKDGVNRIPFKGGPVDLVRLMQDDSLGGGQRSTILNLSIWFSGSPDIGA